MRWQIVTSVLEGHVSYYARLVDEDGHSLVHTQDYLHIDEAEEAVALVRQYAPIAPVSLAQRR
jgi:hypothetical protein